MDALADAGYPMEQTFGYSVEQLEEAGLPRRRTPG